MSRLLELERIGRRNGWLKASAGSCLPLSYHCRQLGLIVAARPDPSPGADETTRAQPAPGDATRKVSA